MGFFETAVGVLGNSHFEGWIASPVMGTILGFVFATLAKPGRDKGSKGRARRKSRRAANMHRDGNSPPSVREVHHHHYHASRGNSNSDDGAFVPVTVVLGVIFAVCLLFFAAYLPAIAFALYFGIAAVAMFCVTAFLVMLLFGSYRLSEHLNSVVLPLIFSVCCLYVAVLARQDIADDVVAYANNALGTGPVKFSRVIGAAFAFFKAIGSEYALWMFFKMLAFILVAIAALVAFGKCLNFVASTNVEAHETWAWRFMESRTKWVSGKGGTVALLLLLIAGALLANGTVFEWTRHVQQ